VDYIALLNLIMSHGQIIKTRNAETKEVMHVTLEIENNLYSFPGIRDLSFILNYWRREWAWYMSGNRDGAYIGEYAKLWARIKNEDGSLNSNYGHLVFYNRTPHLGKITADIQTLPPFEWAAQALEADINSRQGMVTYNTGAFNWVGNKDYICSQHQAFYIRRGQLDCYIALRSSDAIFGLTYNMPWWSFVHQQLFKRLKRTYPSLRLGELKVTIYSAHIYKEHYALVERMLAAEYKTHHALLMKEVPLGFSAEYYFDTIDEYLQIIDNY
jgi:thymidylate synthase